METGSVDEPRVALELLVEPRAVRGHQDRAKEGRTRGNADAGELEQQTVDQGQVQQEEEQHELCEIRPGKNGCTMVNDGLGRYLLKLQI